MRSRRTTAVVVAALLGALAACSSSDGGADTSDLFAPDGVVRVSADMVTRPFPRQLLGTNVPAWLAPDRLKDPEFQQRVVESGTSLLRFPGGSWSNHYDWLACENGEGEAPDDDSVPEAASKAAPGCYWTWAARPSDFLELMDATGLPAMWTVSFNGTAQEAAALVAFFNGAVGDDRVIGVDRHGRDWETVGHWAELRAAHGHPDPTPIVLWEIGNEIYGAHQEAGPGCASFGWEDVWTCEGDAYVAGDEQHDGFLAFHDAMTAVDPTIKIGAVGVAEQGSWSGWGQSVLDGAGTAMGFYVVHHYGFDTSPTLDDAVQAPRSQWPGVMRDVDEALAERGLDDLPVAITEYNLIAFQDNDIDAVMASAVNALYLAENIGAMAADGVSIANQWNIANGTASNGTDYGMIDVDTFEPRPSYFALALWGGFGDEMVMSQVGRDIGGDLQVYAGRDADGTITVLAINGVGHPTEATIEIDPFEGGYQATARDASASAPDATEMQVGEHDLGPVTGPLPYEFAPLSITLLTLTPGPTPTSVS